MRERICEDEMQNKRWKGSSFKGKHDSAVQGPQDPSASVQFWPGFRVLLRQFGPMVDEPKVAKQHLFSQKKISLCERTRSPTDRHSASRDAEDISEIRLSTYRIDDTSASLVASSH